MDNKKNQFACVHYFHKIPNSKEGWDFINRSKFWSGIAQAMAQQWGNK